MVHKINREEFGVTDVANAKVTCFTCHRGSTDPLREPPAGTNFVPRPQRRRSAALSLPLPGGERTLSCSSLGRSASGAAERMFE
jgi:hypothetical protein